MKGGCGIRGWLWLRPKHQYSRPVFSVARARPGAASCPGVVVGFKTGRVARERWHLLSPALSLAVFAAVVIRNEWRTLGQT